MSFLSRGQGKTHIATIDGDCIKRPLCGGGNGARKAQLWQMDIGPASCLACERILVLRAARQRAAEATTKL